MSHHPAKAKNWVFNLQKNLQSISTLLIVNISVCSIFFFLSLYQEYGLNLYNFLLSFILYSSLLSLSLEVLSFLLFLFSKKILLSSFIGRFLRIFLLVFIILFMFAISLWLSPSLK